MNPSICLKIDSGIQSGCSSLLGKGFGLSIPIVLQPPLGPDGFIEEPESTDGTRNPRYKTEICRNFKERSKCIFGEQCQFAHGRRELRDVVRNSKYKTKLCQKYWVSGYCAYGPRCNFLHDEDVEMSAFALAEYGLVKTPMEEEVKLENHPPPVNRVKVHQPEISFVGCFSSLEENVKVGFQRDI